MAVTELIAKVKSEIQAKYEYLTSAEIDELYNTAAFVYLDIRFPYDLTLNEIPENEPRAYNIIKLMMNDIVEKNGCSSLTAYSENGLSVRYDAAGVSGWIRSLITPQVGVPK